MGEETSERVLKKAKTKRWIISVKKGGLVNAEQKKTGTEKKEERREKREEEIRVKLETESDRVRG